MSRELEILFKSKSITPYSKLLYLFLIHNGGIIHYENKIHLASMIGMSRPYLDKSIKELREENLIMSNSLSKVIQIKTY
jgi:hypothetical protein